MIVALKFWLAKALIDAAIFVGLLVVIGCVVVWIEWRTARIRTAADRRGAP